MKRILYISDRYPAVGHGGGERALSIYNALKRIAEVDLFVIAIPVARFPPDPQVRIVHLLDDDSKATRWYWRRRAYLLKDFRPDPKVHAALREVVREKHYDAFFGRYHMPFLAGAHVFGPSFIDVDDLPMDTWSSPLPGFNTLRRMAFARALSHQSTAFVTKQADVRRLEHPDVRLLPCISTMPDRTGPLRGSAVDGRMLFVGGQDWPPNREGISRFISQSLPLVRARSPGALLRVVGRHGSSLNGPEGVDAADFVPELVPDYEQASIVVCPIRRGGGSVVKLAEAAAYGKAIVATPYAARGYEGILEPGRDLLVAESDEEFADACVRLLQDARLRTTLAANALRAATGKLDQAAMDGIIREAMLPRMGG
jgi:glycosyltransferase involved in cell wall biosynthesis